MPRSKNKKTKISLYLLFTIITFLIITTIYLSQKYKSKRTLPTVSEQEHIQDETKGGIYTNYTYGFRFRYDENMFSRQGQDQHSMSFFSETGPKLTITFPDSTDISQKAYDICREYKLNQSFRNGMLVSGTGKKIFENSFGCAFKYDPTGATDIEPEWGYTAKFDIHNKIININLTANNDDQLKKLEEVFSRIYNSLEFINQ